MAGKEGRDTVTRASSLGHLRPIDAFTPSRGPERARSEFARPASQVANASSRPPRRIAKWNQPRQFGFRYPFKEVVASAPVAVRKHFSAPLGKSRHLSLRHIPETPFSGLNLQSAHDWEIRRFLKPSPSRGRIQNGSASFAPCP